MRFPRWWFKAIHPGDAGGSAHPVEAWGWGDDEVVARAEASTRLRRILDRIAAGERLPSGYGYGTRPIREAVLEVVAGPEDAPDAVITRNQYGALVLNTTRLAFVDVDVPEPTLGETLGRLFGRTPVSETIRQQIRQGLARSGWGGTFRLYRTAGGYRVLATDREFRPGNADTAALMTAVGADPAYVNLCRVQQSFRARLTPKPWRCGVHRPPVGLLPGDIDNHQACERWVGEYDATCSRHATCRYLETIGTGRTAEWAAPLVAVHDTRTRADTMWPLA